MKVIIIAKENINYARVFTSWPSAIYHFHNNHINSFPKEFKKIKTTKKGIKEFIRLYEDYIIKEIII